MHSHVARVGSPQCRANPAAQTYKNSYHMNHHFIKPAANPHRRNFMTPTIACSSRARMVTIYISISTTTDWWQMLRPSLFALAAITGLGLPDALATQKEFTNGTSLTAASGYTPTGAPAYTDNVVIDSGSPTGGAFNISAAALNIEDLAFSLATTTSFSNTTTTTNASTLELNGGRGTGVPLLDENSTKTLTIKNGTTGALNVLLGASGSFEVDSSGGLTISSNVGEANAGTALTIAAGTSGTGTVTLSGTNTFSGGLVAAGSEVDVTSDASLGASGGSITINGGRLGFATNSTTIGAARNFYLGANPTGGNTTGTLSIKGSITVTYNGVIQNVAGSTGDLVKQGGGTFQLGNVSTYSGNTFLNNGTTQLIANGTTSTGNLPSTTTVYLGQSASANTGTFDLNGINQQIAGLDSVTGTANISTNTLTSSTGKATLTLGGSGTYVYADGTTTNSGIITGAVSINKTGSGMQTLGGTNTYTGSTSVSAGTLLLSTGSINNSPTVAITGTGALTLQNAAALSDTGTLSLVKGTTLNLNAASGSETIGALSLDGTTEPTGTYTAAELTAFDSGITFSSTSGETLTVVPEPATVLGGFLMIGALGWTVRRRFYGNVS